MGGVRELPIRRPAIAHEHAGKVGAEHRRRFREAATGLNPVDGRVRCRKDPEPLQQARDVPAGFVRTDHRTAAHVGTQRVIRRARLTGRAMDRVHEPAARHGETIQLL